jgi:heptosyltransferase II
VLKQLHETLDFYRLCRSLRPRSVWILEKIGRPAQAAWLAGVPERRGFGLGHFSQERWLSPGPRLPKSMRPAHRIQKLAAFEALHGLAVESREPALRVDPAKVEAVRARFADRPEPWVVLGAGAVDEDRRWPLENFARLSDALSGAGTVFWLGGGAEEEARFSAAMKALRRPDACVLSCDLPLDEAAALISLAALFVGNDSGLMNVAAAVGVPTIGLFGPSPPLSHSRWLTAVVAPTGNLAHLSVESVLAAVEKVRVAHPWLRHPTGAA